MTISRRGVLAGGAALAFVPKASAQPKESAMELTKARPTLRIAVVEVPPTL
jgi:hypothetical protein